MSSDAKVSYGLDTIDYRLRITLYKVWLLLTAHEKIQHAMENYQNQIKTSILSHRPRSESSIAPRKTGKKLGTYSFKLKDAEHKILPT